jgi:hypothetical protein
MTSNVIYFPVYPIESARVDHPDPAPRVRTKRGSRRPAARVKVDQQIAHIAWLLRELEEVASDGQRLPKVLVAEAHASIERARKMLQSWPGARTSGRPEATGEDTAQPYVDHALLERMYGDLGLHP